MTPYGGPGRSRTIGIRKPSASIDASSKSLICRHDRRDVRRSGVGALSDLRSDHGETGDPGRELGDDGIGLDRLVEGVHEPLVGQEVLAKRIRRDQAVHGIGECGQATQVAGGQRRDGRDVHAVAQAEARAASSARRRSSTSSRLSRTGVPPPVPLP